MNLATLIAKREEEGRPIRVGMIGAGKFGTMFLAQAERQRGIHIIGICPCRSPHGQVQLLTYQRPRAMDTGRDT